jgi:membrane-associated phospholipid phosphatase
VPGGLLLILAVLTVNVLADGPLVGADRWIRAAVEARATSGTWRWTSVGWHAPAQLFADLGNYQEAVPVLAACALIVAARHRTLRPLLAAAAAVVLLLATVVPAKILIARTGPGLATLGSGGLGVFPSGHTTTATVCYGGAVLLLLPDLPSRVRRGAGVVRLPLVHRRSGRLGAGRADRHSRYEAFPGVAAPEPEGPVGTRSRVIPKWSR